MRVVPDDAGLDDEFEDITDVCIRVVNLRGVSFVQLGFELAYGALRCLEGVCNSKQCFWLHTKSVSITLKMSRTHLSTYGLSCQTVVISTINIFIYTSDVSVVTLLEM